MARGWRRAYRAEWWIFTLTALSLVTVVFFPWVFRARTEGSLHPHGYCYIWDPALVGSHVAADLLIGVAYVAISITLGYLVYRVRHLLPFHWMFLAFGLFILTCGGTHFMDVWTLWHADFWASAALKIVTAVASVTTALALPPLIPRVARLLEDAQAAEARGVQLRAERREREEAQAESRAKDLFLATLSHEMRTPLHAMGGWTRVLRTTDDGETRRRAIDAVQRNLALQTRLVDDMLDASAIVTGRLTLHLAPVDLARLVHEAVEGVQSTAKAKGLQLDVAMAEAPLVVRADAARVEQILMNLLSNAVKFTGAGGRVGVRLARDGEAAVLGVTDTGVGMSPEFLPRAFEAFSQSDQSSTRGTGGLGLGLAIVQHLVQRHGGSVSAASEGTGRGTTIEVRLPA